MDIARNPTSIPGNPELADAAPEPSAPDTIRRLGDEFVTIGASDMSRLAREALNASNTISLSVRPSYA